MNEIKILSALKRIYPKIDFKYRKGNSRNNDSVFAMFIDKKCPFRFFVRLSIINEHNLHLQFFFGKVSNFNNALFLVNELNAQTSACFKACLHFDKDGYYFMLEYYGAIGCENDAIEGIKGAINFISTNKAIKTYLTPLYELTEAGA